MIQFANIEKICQDHNYPEGFHSLLNDVTKSVIISGTRSVVLIGSASRGELVFKLNPHGSVIFSDLELVVITKRINFNDKQRALKKIDYLEKKQRISGACTFHIDVSFTTVREWQRPKKKFHSWEIKNTGQILYGENLLSLLKVSVKPQYTIQSSLNRLWYLLLYFPRSIFEKQPTQEDLQSFSFILSRAVQDFPLWMLTSKGILVAGFKKRYEYLQKNKDFLSDQDFPIDELIEIVGSALNVRKKLMFEEDIFSVYKVVLNWYPKMLSWEMQSNVNNFDFPVILQHYGNKIYPSLNWKRYLWETRLAAILTKSASTQKAFKWLITHKQGLISTFLWHMHMAALEYINDNKLLANEWLERAQVNMYELWPTNRFPEKEHISFFDSWKTLRYCFFDFLPRFYRGLEQSLEYFLRILKN